METICLVSGGKDSFFSYLHCKSNGYRIVALANLYPAQQHHEDVNSFMYQTVGHTILPQYSTILNTPLYRAPINGSSINQELSYDPKSDKSNHNNDNAHDETEDLYRLIKEILHKHPNVKAVSSGAILSSYQRTRVESICSRLGLISLAWLWQRSQSHLLEEMSRVQLDARIVKVASLGLDQDWLGENVTSPIIRQKLEKLKKWGGNVAGEGGEYETIVVGCGEWDKKIEMQTQVLNEGAGVFLLQATSSELVDDQVVEVQPYKPKLLDDEFQSIFESLPAVERSDKTVSTETMQRPETTPNNDLIANLYAQDGKDAFDQLQDLLQSRNQTTRNITGTLVLLRSMDLFASMNARYKQVISGINPPSRVCVAVDYLPKDVDILLSVTTNDTECERKALHVQSRSYWAPANVGPYSQAIAVDGVVHIAGMIGLIPETMQIWKEGEGVLALQNMVRVGREMSVKKKGWLGGVGYVVDEKLVENTVKTWNDWFQSESQPSGTEFERAQNHDEDDEYVSTTPPLLVVQVAALPISASVEYACLGSTLIGGPEHELEFSHDEYSDKNQTTVMFGQHEFAWGISFVKEMPNFKDSSLIINVTLYATPDTFTHHKGTTQYPVTIVPVTQVWYKGRTGLYGYMVRWRHLPSDRSSQ